MEPTYHDGDGVIVCRSMRYKKNDVVVCHDPRNAERLLIKRIHSVTENDYTLYGDNVSASTDSRSFGAVEKEAIAGKIIAS